MALSCFLFAVTIRNYSYKKSESDNNIIVFFVDFIISTFFIVFSEFGDLCSTNWIRTQERANFSIFP